MAIDWVSRPVFVSSTFRDMQAERDWLRSRVFPELEQRLRERRHHLSPIDLRWGVVTLEIDEQEKKELLVLKVCLNEITRSRPFLIALVGDRYGWIPDAARMQAAVDEAGFQTNVRGKSVTALEIEFGVLDSPEQKRLSHFYFRGPLPYDDMPTEIAAEFSDRHSNQPEAAAAAERLTELKYRIEHDPSLKGRVHHYQAGWDRAQQRVTGLEAFGRQVLEDLWNDLEPETAAYLRQAPRTWQEQERRSLDEFIEMQGRGFIGREEITRQLGDLADSPAQELLVWGNCVCGESGSGKSALFAHLYRQLQGRDDLLLLAQAAGISSRSIQVDSLLRRWIEELALAIGIDDPLNDDSTRDEIEEQFGALLARASRERRVVLLIDALNQFERTPRARHLSWLPKLFPENVRLIATTIPGDESRALARRPGVELVSLPLLDLEEAEQIAKSVCLRYHRTLDERVLEVLLEHRLPDGRPAAGIPLWLELALEELNLLDADDFARADRDYPGTPEQRLQAMMIDVARGLPSAVRDLYGQMLGRSEKLHGLPWARSFADLIALSRHGWRDDDLRPLMPRAAELLDPAVDPDDWDDLAFAALRRTYRAHLVQRGAFSEWDFFHAQMRLAVESRNLNPARVQHLHSLIAEHLQSLPATDPLRLTELMWHLIGTGDRRPAARYYAGLADPSDELTAATRTLADYIVTGPDLDPDPELEWVTSLLELDDLPDNQTAALCNRFLFDLLGALENEAGLPLKWQLLQATRGRLESLAASDPTNAGWQHDLSVSLGNIGGVQLVQGDAAGALASYRASHAIFEVLAASDPTNAGWQRNLSVSHIKIGDVQQAQGDAAAALASYRAGLEIAEVLAASDPTNAGWQRDLSVSLGNIGDVQLAQGDAAGALASYRAALVIAERLAASDPTNAGWQRDLAVFHYKLAQIYQQTGDTEAAMQEHRHCHATLCGMRERGLFLDPPAVQILAQLDQMFG